MTSRGQSSHNLASRLEGYFKEVADILHIQGKEISWNQEVEIAKRYGQEFLDSLRHWT